MEKMRSYKDTKVHNFQSTEPKTSTLQMFSNYASTTKDSWGKNIISTFQFYPEEKPGTALYDIFENIRDVALNPLLAIRNIEIAGQQIVSNR